VASTTLVSNLNVDKLDNQDGSYYLARANHTGTQSATTVELDEIGTSTFDDIQDWNNTTQSAGIISGSTISDGGSGTVDISAGIGILKKTNSNTGDNVFFDIGSSSGISLTDNSVNYISVDYNSGTPQYTVSTSNTANGHNIFNIGKVYRDGTDVDIINSGLNIYDIAKRIQQKDVEEAGLQFVSGARVSETGTRNIEITSGILYAGINRIETDAIDTSLTDTFKYYYYTGVAWTESDQTQIDNTQYNDTASGLVTLSNNKYGVHWIYKGVGDRTYVVYGQGDYTLSEAQTVQPPSSLPDHVYGFGVLRAKIIIKKSATAFTEIENIIDTQFSAQSPSVHNELSGLQGGTANEYYHLTAAKHGYIDQDVTSGSSPTLDGANITGIPDGALDETYINADGSVGLSSDWDAGPHKITAETLESDVTTGTAPLTVASTTLVSNLNVDKLDNQDGSYYLARANHTGTQTASTISDFDTEVSNNSTVSTLDSRVDQDVTSGSSPTLDGTNFTGIPDGALDETYINADGSVGLSSDWDAGAHDISAQSLSTNAAAANISASGTSITAGGTDTNVDIGITAKGTGTTTITGGLTVKDASSNVQFNIDTTNNNTIVGDDCALSASGATGLTLIGEEAGQSITSGDNHTMVGFEAGSSITTQESNTGIGYQSLKNSVSNYNIGIGTQAGYNITSGDGENLAIGYKALYGNASGLTGKRNTGLGSECGINISTGVYNNFVGWQAGYNLTTGSRNFGFGSQALYTMTTQNDTLGIGHSACVGMRTNRSTFIGSYSGAGSGAISGVDDNTAVGSYSLQNVTGTRNCVLGAKGAQAATSCDDSVFIGYEAGNYLTSGDDNCIIGSYAASNATSATNRNVVIGKDALLYGGDAAATCNDNVIIGFQAQDDSTPTAISDCIAIGSGTSITANADNVILIGKGATTATADQIMIGNSSHSTCFIKGFATGGTLANVEYNTSTGELKSIDQGFQTISFSTDIAIDFSDGPNQHVVLTNDFSLSAPSNMEDGAIYRLLLEQDVGGGNSLLSANSAFQFEDADVDLDTDGGAFTLITMVCDGSTLYCYTHSNFGTFTGPS
jgi:hypothetical protein